MVADDEERLKFTFISRPSGEAPTASHTLMAGLSFSCIYWGQILAPELLLVLWGCLQGHGSGDGVRQCRIVRKVQPI